MVMTKKKISIKSQIYYLTLFLLILIAFWFRYFPIRNGYSFWSDEALISSLSRDIVTNKLTYIQAIKVIPYQPLQVLTVAIFFKFFGISEYAARLPSVLLGTIGVLFAFLIAKKLSNIWAAFLAAYLYAFSQINLANATQAKPYATIQTLLLIACYLLISIDKKSIKTKSFLLINIIIFITFSIATLFHAIGVLYWIIYILYILINFYRQILRKLANPLFFLLSLISLIVFILFFKIDQYIMNMIKLFGSKSFLIIVNNTMYLKNLLGKQYFIFTISAILGLVLSFKEYKAFIIGIFSWIIVLLFMWNFQVYSHNIRYLLPLFGIIFTFAAIFWGKLGEKLTSKFHFIIPLTIIILLFLTKYKIVAKPLNYYSPNLDFYGDIQIADYKTTYSLIKRKWNLEHIAIFNDVIDNQRWYLDKQATAYLMRSFGDEKPSPHPLDKKITIYKNLGQFLEQKDKYQKGILIVEDWQSFLPEDIKQYAKKNMKLEFRVEGLKEAGGDNWPLEVYSWGI